MSINQQQSRASMAASKTIRCSQFSATLSTAILLVSAVAGMATGLGQSTAYDVPVHPVTATVGVLALSDSVSVYTSREEIYLAIVSVRSRTNQLAKLVDSYPSYGNPILRSLLIEHRQLRMTLVRNPECDSTGRRFFLGPEDANIFDVSTRSELLDHDADTIPCFTVIHSATRLSK